MSTRSFPTACTARGATEAAATAFVHRGEGIRTVVNFVRHLRQYGVVSRRMPDHAHHERKSRRHHVFREAVSGPDRNSTAHRRPRPHRISDSLPLPSRGADRTGLASTVARLLLTSDDLSSRGSNSGRGMGTLPLARTAILDSFFDYYAQWLAERGEAHSSDRFRHWRRTSIVPDLTAYSCRSGARRNFPPIAGLRSP